MSREKLEQHQVWIYLIAVIAGATIGLRLRPTIAEVLVYAPLGLLLYATFVQTPILHIAEALRNPRFLVATLVANFVIVPIAVWLIGWLIPREQAILLGFYLVLLVPCTDWFIVFAHLGKGDVKLAIAGTPLILFVQFALLPVYLWLFMGQAFSEIIVAGHFLNVFLMLIVIPLMLAGMTQYWADRIAMGRTAIEKMAWIPVPCLALVLFMIALWHAGHVVDDLRGMERVALAFVIYLAAAPLIGIFAARLFALPADAGRALIFSVGTRNSFVVLPFAIALPAGWEPVVTVVVLQSLIELVGMLVYLRMVPRWSIVPAGAETEMRRAAS